MSKKINILDIKKRCNMLGMEILNIKSSFNSKTKISLIDKDKYKYFLSYDNIRKNKKYKIFSIENPYTIDNIEMFIINNKLSNKLMSKKYEWCNKTLLFKCQCGEEYKYPLNKFIYSKKQYCNKCSLIKKGENTRLNKDDVFAFIENLGFEILNKENYINTETKLILKDVKGYKYIKTYHQIMYKHINISKFYINNPFTIDNMKNFLKINNMTCELLDFKWYGNNFLYTFKCECGNEFKTTWSIISAKNITRSKNRCDFCTNKISNIEYKIKQYLELNNICFKQQVKFLGLKNKNHLKFDFGIYQNDKLKFLIEVQGMQHYKAVQFGNMTKQQAEENLKYQKIKDDKKRKYCFDNNIPLLEIKYKYVESNKYKELIENMLN